MADSYFDQYFTFDNTLGIIKIKNNLDLHQQNLTNKFIPIVVSAKDKGNSSLYSTLNCTIFITGDNKFAPEFSYDNIIIATVPSNISIGDRVIKVNTTNKDLGSDGELSYTISTNDAFTISSTREITISNLPTKGFYYLTVTVSDRASITKRKHANGTLLVYYPAKSSPTGVVYIGANYGNPTINAVKYSMLTIPIYVQLGTQTLEAFDINVNFSSSIVSFVSSASAFHVSNQTSSIRIVYLTDPKATLVGVVKVADLYFKGSKSIAVDMTSTVNAMMDRNGKYIPESSTPTKQPCSNVMFTDTNNDCKFDLIDIALVQYYAKNYISLQSGLSDRVKSDLDADMAIKLMLLQCLLRTLG